MIKNPAKKIFLLNLCLLSFFMNTLWSHTPHAPSYEEDKTVETRAALLLSSFFISFLSICGGSLLMAMGIENEREFPITHQDKVLFILRSCMPQEEREQFLLQQKELATRQKDMGKKMIIFGLLGIPASFFLVNIDVIIKHIFKEMMHEMSVSNVKSSITTKSLSIQTFSFIAHGNFFA